MKLLIWPIFQGDFRWLSSVKNALLRSISGPQITVSLGNLWQFLYISINVFLVESVDIPQKIDPSIWPAESVARLGPEDEELLEGKQSVLMGMGPIDIKLESQNLRGRL